MNGNAAEWFVGRNIREGRADKAAFIEAWDGGRTLTYGDLADGAARCASALHSSGVAQDERAAMFVLDQVEFPTIFWGALKAGVQPIALNTLLATDVYLTILNDSAASIAFVSHELLDVVLPAALAATNLHKIVVIGGDAPAGTTSYVDFVKDATPAETIARSGKDVAFWLYSSGSTGVPKGVRHQHEALQVTCDTYGQQVLGIKENDTIFSVAKLFFAYGLGNGMSFPMSAGATAFLFNGRPTPDTVSEMSYD